MNTNNQIILSKLYVASATPSEGLKDEEITISNPIPCAQKNASGSFGAVKNIESFREEAKLLGKSYANALIP